MKYIYFFLMFIFIGAVSTAQETDATKRPVSVKIIDKKGRPIKNVVLSSHSNTQKGKTDRAGQFIFLYVSDDDSITVKLPGAGQIIIPIAGMDSIEIRRSTTRSYYYLGNDSQSVMIEKAKTSPSTTLDVPELLKKQYFSSLIDLLRGNVPGLSIGYDNSANIRGASSFHMSTEPLVVVNGMVQGTLSEVNNLLNVNDIKTVEVLKHGAEYGVRGSNGVILIKTK